LFEGVCAVLKVYKRTEVTGKKKKHYEIMCGLKQKIRNMIFVNTAITVKDRDAGTRGKADFTRVFFLKYVSPQGMTAFNS